jgi:hypothetical protein
LAIAAYPATLKIGANAILDIQNHDLPFHMDTDETTAFSGSGGAAVGTKTFVPTLLGMQCKITGSWNKGDTTGQAILETNFFARTKTTLIYSPNGTNTYTFGAWITDYHVVTDPKSRATVEFGLLMDGTVTLA